jgi:SAM-dependent methyltransferase
LEAPQYDIHADVEDVHWWWRARREILADVIARYVPAAGPAELRLAEVGCGSGGNLPMLRRFGTVLGAELDATALEHLRRKHGDAFPAVQHRIPEPLPEKVDVLALFDVLEHVPDDRGALAWAASQLEAGGTLVLTVPAFQFLWTEQDEAVHHLRRYTPASLLAALPEDLVPVHLTCFNSLLFAPILAVRTAMRLIPRGDRPPRSHLAVPPALINWLLYRILRSERHLVPKWRLPLGVSVLLVARKSGAPSEARAAI